MKLEILYESRFIRDEHELEGSNYNRVVQKRQCSIESVIEDLMSAHKDSVQPQKDFAIFFFDKIGDIKELTVCRSIEVAREFIVNVMLKKRYNHCKIAIKDRGDGILYITELLKNPSNAAFLTR